MTSSNLGKNYLLGGDLCGRKSSTFALLNHATFELKVGILRLRSHAWFYELVSSKTSIFYALRNYWLLPNFYVLVLFISLNLNTVRRTLKSFYISNEDFTLLEVYTLISHTSRYIFRFAYVTHRRGKYTIYDLWKHLNVRRSIIYPLTKQIFDTVLETDITICYSALEAKG